MEEKANTSSCLGTVGCVCVDVQSPRNVEWFGLDRTVMMSPLVHVLRQSSCDDMSCLSIMGQRRGQRQASGQRRVFQQVHREEWKRRLSIPRLGHHRFKQTGERSYDISRNACHVSRHDVSRRGRSLARHVLHGLVFHFSFVSCDVIATHECHIMSARTESTQVTSGSAKSRHVS